MKDDKALRRKLLRITKDDPYLTRCLLAAARDFRLPEAIVVDARQAAGHFIPLIGHCEYEVLAALFLDRRHRVLAEKIITKGNDAHTIVDPKQIYREALHLGAAAVILAHNHPSGDPEPSETDIEVTRRVGMAGRIINIELIDHLVIASRRWVSMRERGLMGDRHHDIPLAMHP